MFKPFKRQNSVVKIWQLIGGGADAGPPSMVQPAQWLIRPWPEYLAEFLDAVEEFKSLVMVVVVGGRS